MKYETFNIVNFCVINVVEGLWTSLSSSLVHFQCLAIIIAWHCMLSWTVGITGTGYLLLIALDHACYHE